ncbi:globin domain-containing protein [Nocardia sp. NPDC058658]|uniref:globin domain-containing protein n=1 Tax=Nocardia sp. NPDC058658 TaxID=3346580 RepID=UPI0036549B25
MTTFVQYTEPELDTADADIIRATLPLIGVHIDSITTAFYRRLFDDHPELLRDLFNRGNQAAGSQPKALAASIAVYATYLIDPELPHPAQMLSRIAHKHVSLGVTAAQYEVVHDNLFAAIVEVLGVDVVTAPVAQAWDRVFWMMAGTLIAEEDRLYADAGVAPGDVFRDVMVVARQDDTFGVAVFAVESMDAAKPLPSFVPGQYVSVGVQLDDGARQLRQYSLVGAPAEGRLAFAVKRVDAANGCPAGEVSGYLHEYFDVGDQLQITVPFGDLTVEPSATTPLILISAGIGTTPMIGVLEHLVAHNPNRPVQVLHADRTPESHPLRDRQRVLVSRLSAGTKSLWYTGGGDGARTGRMDLSDVKLLPGADVYVCGAPDFLESVRAQLVAAGVRPERVHLEQFTPTDWRLPSCPA